MASVLSSSVTGNNHNFGMFVLGSGGLGAATLTLSAMTGDESCSEVSSSSPLTGASSSHGVGGAVSPPSLLSVGMSPHTSLASNEITDVDLDFWDLDLNSHSPPHGLSSIAAATTTVANIHKSLAQLTETKFDPSTLNLQNSPPDIKFDPSTLGDFGRDDISPSGSNGFMDNYSIDLKKKKGPVPRQAEELCLVCGDRASGYHYNALTCEGCKGFFRRSITKNAVYRCKYGDNCEMDMYMRRKCQECRLKKCLNVGMRPECVVPEYQCQVKREQKKAREKDKKPDIQDLGSPIMEETKSMLSPQSSYEDSLGGFPKPKLAPLPVNPNPGPPPRNGVKPLSREQEELIQTLVYYQEEYEQPSEEDLKKITFSFDTEDTSDMRFKHITEMTILTVQLIVEFSKRLPGFDTLQREDQITLLKACSSEVMMLRAARRYDANTDSIVFGNSYPYTQDSYDMAGLGDSADVLFRFCRNLCKMKVDNAEYALLAAIAIFSERPQLVELRKVEKLQEIYLDALKAYVENRRTPQSTLVFAKLLNVLTELRTLGNINAEVCFSLTVKNKKLPPFLAEIWDVHQC